MWPKVMFNTSVTQLKRSFRDTALCWEVMTAVFGVLHAINFPSASYPSRDQNSSLLGPNTSLAGLAYTHVIT